MAKVIHFVKDLWPILLAVFGIIWWLAGLDNRVANAEAQLEENQVSLVQIQSTLQEFKSTQEQHNGQDAVFQAKMDGKMEVINSKLEAIIKGQERLENRIFLGIPQSPKKKN